MDKSHVCPVVDYQQIQFNRGPDTDMDNVNILIYLVHIWGSHSWCHNILTNKSKV